MKFLVSAAGCGDITYLGGCDGNTLLWCDPETDTLQQSDCSNNEPMGWQVPPWEESARARLVRLLD